MLLGLCLLFWAFFGTGNTAPAVSVRDHNLACDMKFKHEQCTADSSSSHHPPEPSDNRRLIAIGDVHGSYEGLLELLHASGITTSNDKCEWKSQGDEGVVLVQQGDLVDRGPQAWEALQCLKHLQSEAPKFSSKVVRLIGSKIVQLNDGILNTTLFFCCICTLISEIFILNYI